MIDNLKKNEKCIGIYHNFWTDKTAFLGFFCDLIFIISVCVLYPLSKKIKNQ